MKFAPHAGYDDDKLRDTDPRSLTQLEEDGLQGDVQALYLLGWKYRNPRPRDNHKQDDGKAVEFWQLGASEGHMLCNHRLAYMYKKGWGVQKCDTKAETLWKDAADAGIAGAQYSLGRCLLERGRETEALEYLRKAADQYHEFANSLLAEIHLKRAQEAGSGQGLTYPNFDFKESAIMPTSDLEHGDVVIRYSQVLSLPGTGEYGHWAIYDRHGDRFIDVWRVPGNDQIYMIRQTKRSSWFEEVPAVKVAAEPAITSWYEYAPAVKLVIEPTARFTVVSWKSLAVQCGKVGAVSEAIQQLGTSGTYNLANSNCEHWVRSLFTGTSKESSQVAHVEATLPPKLASKIRAKF
eukprot:gnl/MRDRNA2_/MRDRNA2_42814_c0_seq1.p1 gnl/MRDRNA2_/MRDRNA2_42814_c0~~gnl/MRDRNA2_/MRDRNA2_42814_c0_seq1.p1  ORF type:complete len:350 (-),score=58.88 gnl/MRDRNA2_/MRDRNA2_42814_c0_seq1:144-1193(-)